MKTLNIQEDIEFFLSHGYNVLETLIIARYFEESDYISGKSIKIVGHKLKIR